MKGRLVGKGLDSVCTRWLHMHMDVFRLKVHTFWGSVCGISFS